MKVVEKRPIICGTIFAKDQNGFARIAGKAVSLGCDMVELRVDHLKVTEHELMGEIIAKSPLPIIATNRSAKEGGRFPISRESERISLLKSIISCIPAFVDVELEMKVESRSELIRLAKKNDVGVICSHHDFKGTPNIDRVSALIRQMFQIRPDIAKLVFTPRNYEDASRILSAAYDMGKSGDSFTIFGMGQFGKVTRLTSLLLGGCLVYCTVEKNDNHLGQIGAESAGKYLAMANRVGWSHIRRNRRKLLGETQKALRAKKTVNCKYLLHSIFEGSINSGNYHSRV